MGLSLTADTGEPPKNAVLPTFKLEFQNRNLSKIVNKQLSVEISIFFIIEILREINFEDSRSAKSAILTQFEALNF